LKVFDNGTFVGGVETSYTRRAGPTIFAGVFIPFGVNFRLCKAKDIWNQNEYLFEGKYGIGNGDCCSPGRAP